MRLLITTDTVGGVWTFSMTLGRELALRGHEVHVATSGPPMSDAQRREASGVRNLRVHERPSRLEWEEDPRGDLWEEVDRWTESLHRLADAVDPHVVHLNAFAPATSAWDRPVVLTAHSDVETWWRSVHGETAPAGYDRYRRTVSAALERPAEVVAPTRAYGRAIADAYGASRALRTVHNGLDLELFELGIKSKMVLAAGRLWDEAKNVAALAAAAPEIRHRCGADVFAAGETGGASLADSLDALGRLSASEMRQALRRAAVYVHPARYEPFGLLPLEAAASGCALVLSDIPTLRELWSGAALFVSPDEPGTLADHVVALMDSDDLRATVAKAGRERAQRYRATLMADAYEALYRDSAGSADGSMTRIGAFA